MQGTNLPLGLPVRVQAPAVEALRDGPRAAGGHVESGGNEWICVEGRVSVGGSEHEAWVLVKGPGFGVGPALGGVRKQEDLRVDTGLGVTYSHGKRGGGDGRTWESGMVLSQLLALAGLQVVIPGPAGWWPGVTLAVNLDHNW